MTQSWLYEVESLEFSHDQKVIALEYDNARNDIKMLAIFKQIPERKKGKKAKRLIELDLKEIRLDMSFTSELKLLERQLLSFNLQFEKKHKQRRIYYKTRTISDKNLLNRINRNVTDSIEKFKREQLEQFICMWRKIKQLNNKNYKLDKNKRNNITLDGVVSPSDGQIADAFAKQLQTTFSLDINEFNHNKDVLRFNISQLKQSKKEEIKLVTLEEFNNCLKSLKKDSAQGPDYISYNHLKYLPDSAK
ncbi:hypothetical protein BpHYR1_020715, partial [Brachionus plicatilis]